MNKLMTDKKWREFLSALKFRKAQLEADLKANNYIDTISIRYSMQDQLDAIEVLIEQTPWEIQEAA